MGGRSSNASRNSGNEHETLKEFTDRFIKESGEDRWNMSLQRENQLKAQAAEIYKKQNPSTQSNI